MRLGDLDDLKKAIEELEITEELVDYDCDDVSTTGVSQYLDRPAVPLLMTLILVVPNKCSKCGRLIAILPSKLADYPFCHCGAEMKKGGEE